MIRDLRADEIEARVQSVTENGCVVLLYKNARCDMNILDETFGSLNWKRDHTFIDGKCYCTVSVWDEKKSQWVGKQDVGTESNQDSEKGQASDAFKRACFNWGIGRELYTSPFVFVPASKCNIADRNGKKTCYDSFDVSHIVIKDKVITELAIVNTKTGEEVYRYTAKPSIQKKSAKGGTTTSPKEENLTEKPTEPVVEFEDRSREEVIRDLCKKSNKKYESFWEWCRTIYKVNTLDDLGITQYEDILKMFRVK